MDGVGDGGLDGARAVAELAVGFGVGEVGVALEGVEGVFRVERRLFLGLVIEFGEWGGEFGEPEREEGSDGLSTGSLGDELEKFGDGDVVTGKDETFASAGFIAGGKDALGDVANVNEVVATFDAGFESTGGGVDDELGEVAGFEIIGADDAGRMDNTGVEAAILDGFEDVAGGFGFGFGVFAFDLRGVEIGDFGDDGAVRKFGESVNAVDIDKFSANFEGFLGDVLGAEDVDVIDGGVGL